MTRPNASEGREALTEPQIQRPTLAGFYRIERLRRTQPDFMKVVNLLDGDTIAFLSFLHIADEQTLALPLKELESTFRENYQGEFFSFNSAREFCVGRYFTEYVGDTADEKAMLAAADPTADPAFVRFVHGWKFVQLSEPSERRPIYVFGPRTR